MKPPTPGMGTERNWGAVLKRSSFGPAALLLDRQARADLSVFYGYCRAIDDCADEFKPDEARGHLRLWKRELELLAKGRPATDLGRSLEELCARRKVPAGLLMDLWQGASSDARPAVRFKTWASVRAYCYQVAGSVGLVCLPIFDLDLDRAGAYARALGEAFQLINILRDVREDASLGRLYFALEDLERHGLAPEEFMAGKGGARAQRLIYAYAWRARAALRTADAEAGSLPAKGLRPSRMMRAIYGGLLERMSSDSFRVFEKRYSLGPWRKRWVVVRGLVAA
ncbi:MAG TPA: squalene/phytoene synthase family protein [bacterium]|jgi:phytoene/squalene synthetase|nr:squalene/phytoene synthase family protein [bacterium]